MKKHATVWTFILLFTFSFSSRADEGMWLVHLLGEQVYNDMVKKGLKLTREQLYSINRASIKDAIVIFGNGCTGELVSAQGLIFTNHHCGYGAIAAASGIQNNYLKDGFWAKSKGEEIPAAGLTVRFLVKIDDVTTEVEKQLAGLAAAERMAKQAEVLAGVIKKATEGTGYEAVVSPLFKGNQFLLFTYERFTDIRLVGTPPESIGRFGGDTDNWEWPRHTGDFSVFRVYAGKNGKPADHAPDNIPHKPKYFLPVSTKGFGDGDFAMIYGYPGTTNRYETSFGVKLKTGIENPSLVDLRDVRLKLMMDEMVKDPTVRLRLASTYATIANYWKFFDGESKQLLRYKIYEQKQEAEQKFIVWAKGKPQYENIFANYEKVYADWEPYAAERVYYNEGIMGSPLTKFAATLETLEKALSKGSVDKEIKGGSQNGELKRLLETVDKARTAFLSAENIPSDRSIVAATCMMFYQDVDQSQHPKGFYENLLARYGDLDSPATYQKMAQDIFSGTVVLDNSKWNALMAKPDLKILQSDPAYQYAMVFSSNYSQNYLPKYNEYTAQKNELGRLYLKGIREMTPNAVMYPDATFTMRVSYGSVKSYRPRDAVFYNYVCTLGGVMEKYRPGDYEFDLPKSLVEAYNKKEYGNYKDSRVNDLVVAFITTNDITGGSSGSPVINANGELIGLAFDGNYEALSHQIAFDKDLNRTICVDVRYLLWCIDILGGAKNIINELSLK
jgi:hypothetical protein